MPSPSTSRRARRPRARDLHVLESFPDPRSQTNPYISQLLRALRSEPPLRVTTFSWRAALTGSYDVFHVHWPDALVQARSPARRAGKYVLFTFLLIRLRLRRVAVVRTVHNAHAHEHHAVTGFFDRMLDLMTAARIHLGGDATEPGGVVIPHGHYRDWLGEHPPSAVVPARLLFIGHIRRYKGIPDLLNAFQGLAPDRGASLVIAGQPRDTELVDRIRQAAAQDRRLSAVLQYVTDADFVRLVTEAQLVVLPYRNLENSGVALAALSLDRPVLAPRTPSTLALREEVGAQWVLLFDPPLSAPQLRDALDRSSGEVGAGVRFADRDWSDTGARHRAVFESAVRA